MKNRIDNIFTSILVICALIITFFVLRKEFFAEDQTLSISSIENWEKLLPHDAKASANNPKVFLIEFFDYECPFCSTLDATLDTIKLKYKDKIKIIRYHYPLTIHPLAYRAAISAECANSQSYFDVYHKEIMKNQYKLNNINFTDIARKINIKDIGKFQKCIDTEETADIIAKNVQLAKDYKISGTPTLIINNKMISGAVGSKEIEIIINEFL